MELGQRLEQKQVMGQRMQLSLRILQMNAPELDAYLRELSLENPLIEELPSRGRVYPLREPPRRGAELPDAGDESLAEHLRAQIAALDAPPRLRRELMYLVSELDERGYLAEDCTQLGIFGGEAGRGEAALRVFQSLEPAGVGARSLSECLALQLRRRGEDGLALAVCENYLDRLAKGQFNYIARALGTDAGSVRGAWELISSLSPIPSNGFAGRRETEYVVPDVEILAAAEGLSVSAAERYMPEFRLDGSYAAMAADPSLTAEEREYFSGKLAEALWALRCVEKRRDMLLECARAVCDTQRAFLSDGVSPIKPCTMSELAERLGVHVSTVSRAVRGKYLACRWGAYPLGAFFRRAGAGGVTAPELTARLRALIASEPPERPLSDMQLAARLAEEGIRISRRTAAKYREEAGIPPAALRRRRG